MPYIFATVALYDSDTLLLE